MNKSLPLFLAVFLMLPLCARAELSVSVTITGDVEEIMPLLEHLKQMGAGVASAGEDPLKLRMLSVHSDGAAVESTPPVDATTPAEPLPAAPAGPRLSGASVNPAEVSPGLTVLFSVSVQDGDGAVDTVTATFAGGNFAVDLYDNGTNGDTAAADGTWSANVLVPEDLAAGEYEVAFSAYGSNGKEIDAAKTSATARVVRVETAAPAVETPPAQPEAAPAAP